MFPGDTRIKFMTDGVLLKEMEQVENVCVYSVVWVSLRKPGLHWAIYTTLTRYICVL